jgi:hypothetical protein
MQTTVIFRYEFASGKQGKGSEMIFPREILNINKAPVKASWCCFERGSCKQVNKIPLQDFQAGARAIGTIGSTNDPDKGHRGHKIMDTRDNH